MKPKQNLAILLLVLVLLAATLQAVAQSATPASFKYKEMVTDNPTAERDIQAVSTYVNAMVTGEQDKARALLATNFKTFGPGPLDSADVEKLMNSWQENYKTHSNRKVSMLWQTFRVVTGDLKGNWVSVWGNYSGTINGKEIMVPFHNACHLNDEGKIDREFTYFDNLSILMALGFKLVPPKQPKKQNKIAAR